MLGVGLLVVVVLVGAGVTIGLRSESEDSAATPASSSSRAEPSRTAPNRTATAEQPATASFEFHTLEPGYRSSFYALGIVTNTSTFTIDKPKVTAVLFNAQGDEVGTSSGYGARNKLEPGQRSPVKILIKDPPDHDSIRYETVARRSTWTPDLVAGLRVEASEPKPASFGNHRWEVSGKVHNDGAQRAKFVNIEIQALDADGKLIGLGSSYADGEVLEPNSDARWSTSVTAAGSVDRFEYAVTGRLPN